MNQSEIVRECTKEFEEKLRAAVELAEQEGVSGVEVEINIHVVDDEEKEYSCRCGAPRNSREKSLERLKWTEREMQQYTVKSDERERLEEALLEYMERIAAGELSPDEKMPDIVEAGELLDKLLSRREGK